MRLWRTRVQVEVGKKRGEGCKSYGEVAQLVRAQDSYVRQRRTWVQCTKGARSPILATTPVMKMAGVFIIVITRSIIVLFSCIICPIH